MTGLTATKSILTDAFSRVHDLVGSVTEDLSLEVATYRPDADANSISWLVWHLSRIQDDHLAGLAGTEQVWPGWRDRFALPLDDFDHGYGHTSEQVATVRVGAELLAGYHAAVHERTLHYLDELTVADLDQVIDTSWDPPVTVSVRLVSVLADALQHAGQAAYLRGLAERADAPAP